MNCKSACILFPGTPHTSLSLLHSHIDLRYWHNNHSSKNYHPTIDASPLDDTQRFFLLLCFLACALSRSHTPRLHSELKSVLNQYQYLSQQNESHNAHLSQYSSLSMSLIQIQLSLLSGISPEIQCDIIISSYYDSCKYAHS